MSAISVQGQINSTVLPQHARKSAENKYNKCLLRGFLNYRCKVLLSFIKIIARFIKIM